MHCASALMRTVCRWAATITLLQALWQPALLLLALMAPVLLPRRVCRRHGCRYRTGSSGGGIRAGMGQHGWWRVGKRGGREERAFRDHILGLRPHRLRAESSAR